MLTCAAASRSFVGSRRFQPNMYTTFYCIYSSDVMVYAQKLKHLIRHLWKYKKLFCVKTKYNIITKYKKT